MPPGQHEHGRMALPSHVALDHKTVHDSIDGGRLFPETAVPTRPISHGLWHRRTLRSSPRQRPPDLYRHNVDQTSRRHRTTVSGWTISRASRQCGHHHDSKIQNSRSQTRKQGRRVPLRFNTAIWWRSAIASNSSAVRLPGSPRVTATASSLGIVMCADCVWRTTDFSTQQFATYKIGPSSEASAASQSFRHRGAPLKSWAFG